MFYKKTTERGVTKLEKIERDGLTYKRFRGKGRILSSKLKPKEPGTMIYFTYDTHNINDVLLSLLLLF